MIELAAVACIVGGMETLISLSVDPNHFPVWWWSGCVNCFFILWVEIAPQFKEK